MDFELLQAIIYAEIDTDQVVADSNEKIDAEGVCYKRNSTEFHHFLSENWKCKSTNQTKNLILI